MAANILRCLLGCLALACLVAAGSIKPTTSKPDKDVIICEFYTIKHADQREPTKLDIDDDVGRPADITDVTVEQQLSKAPCVKDDSFMFEESAVFVRKGCHAKFNVCYRSSKGQVPVVKPGCKLVRGLSRLTRKVELIQSSTIISMRVARQLSQGDTCKKDNFGYKDKVAFADKGCRADFEICLKDSKPDDDDEPVCVSVIMRSSKQIKHDRKIKDDEGNDVDIVSIALLTEFSKEKCMPYQTFTYEDSTVTASDGCEGRFRVCYVPDNIRPEATLPTGCIYVRLLSKNNVDDRRQVAEMDGRIKSIELKRQYGGETCVKDKNFGISKQEVYAKSGCRGQFLVCVQGLEFVTDKPKTTCINVKMGIKNGSDRKGLTRNDGKPAKIESIRLLRQDSPQDCILKKTFDTTSSQVTTSGGCRGIFRVCYSET